MQRGEGLRERLRWLSMPLCFLSCIVLDYGFRYVYLSVEEVELSTPSSALFTVGWALMFTGLAALLPGLARRIVTIGASCLFSALIVVHGAFYNIFGHFFSFSDLNYAGDGAKFFSWSYVKVRKALLPCIVLGVLLMVAAALLVRRKEEEEKDWTYWPKKAGVVLLATVGFVMVARTHRNMMPVEEYVWWGSSYDENAAVAVEYERFTDPSRWMMETGLYQYTVRDLMVSTGWGGGSQSLEKLDEFFRMRGEQISGENEMTGVFRGKDLMMIMLESIDTWLLTEDYMPNLYRLQQEGIDFQRFYTPLHLTAGTFNTEIVSQTGLFPSSAGVNVSNYVDNSFPLSLAHLFREAGYRADSFHSASRSIYSRWAIHTNLGFEHYYNYVEMEMEDYQLDSQMMGGYQLMTGAEPFFTYIITYSGHGPYTEEMGNISAPHMERAEAAVARSGVEGAEEDMAEYTQAVAHAMETDAFVGELLAALEADGKLEDTVLLFYTDHYGKYMTNKRFLCQVKGVEADGPELYRTPCFLYSADQQARKVDKYVSTVDLMPTLINAFGLDAERRWYVGDDIFGDRGGFVIFPGGSWLDESGYWSGSDAKADRERAADVRARVDACADCLKLDYFREMGETS